MTITDTNVNPEDHKRVESIGSFSENMESEITNGPSMWKLIMGSFLSEINGYKSEKALRFETFDIHTKNKRNLNLVPLNMTPTLNMREFVMIMEDCFSVWLLVDYFPTKRVGYLRRLTDQERTVFSPILFGSTCASSWGGRRKVVDDVCKQ